MNSEETQLLIYDLEKEIKQESYTMKIMFEVIQDLHQKISELQKQVDSLTKKGEK